MTTLRLKDISKHFGKTKALDNINLEIKEGTFCVVLGPSGCGKSTLLNLIAGLEEPTTGRIFLGDKDITMLPPHKRNIAMVFQNYALYPHLSAFENIAFGLRIKKEKEDGIRLKVEGVSKILNIEDKLEKFPGELSGGERQRVATGRAIVREPILFLFDEPLSNLDARLRVELRAEFIKLHRRLKKTIIYVTHDQVEAMALGEEVVVIKDGEIQQISTPKELYNNPRNLFVASFIGTPPMNILKLKVKKTNNRLKLTYDDFILDIPARYQKALAAYIDDDIHVGFRPSAVSLRTSESDRSNPNLTAPIKADLLFTETIGEDTFALLCLHPTIEITIKLPETQKLTSKTPASLTIDTTKIYFFDLIGKRI